MRRLREYPPNDDLEGDGEVDPVFKPPPPIDEDDPTVP